ncbi:MAG: T9SS type A sorting domain-containing protein [Pedobacter sp.]|nr:MAG: T9SS type A sorting domain-containing protein [Pedobacter sp.]
MKQHLRLFLFLLFAYSTSKAQVLCGAEILHQRYLKTDTAYAKAAKEANDQINKAVQKRKAAQAGVKALGMQATIYNIPVVFHIMHTGGAEGTIYNPSTSNIQAALSYLNSVYNGTSAGNEGAGEIGIQFVLATRDPQNNPTTGIDRVNLASLSSYVDSGVALQTAGGLKDTTLKSLVRWDPGLYYNIYVVNKIDGKDGTEWVAFVAGYAQYPSVAVRTDGAVMLATQMLPDQKTLPHEIGHALGLAHPFEGSSGSTCPANATCATQGDQICDTDPITIPAGFASRTGQTNPCTGTLYTINTEHNFMNYTETFTLFTADQRTRMLSTMTFPTRASLAASWATVANYPYSFSNPVANCDVSTDPVGVTYGVAGIVGVTVGGTRTFSSGIATTDFGYLNKSSSPLHIIPVSRNNTYSLATDLYTPYPAQYKVWIDYNNDGLYTDATELIASGNNIASASTYTRVTSSFTIPATAVTDNVLRMRIINDVSTAYAAPIANGCHHPAYGQGEDFPIFVAGILPVTWKYFRGRKSNYDVYLQWGTASESNNRRFEVQRSTDGLDYYKIGTIASSSILRDYDFTDHNAVAPVYFYRLKQVDNDGRETLSSVIIVRNDQPGDAQSVQVVNPFGNAVDFVLANAYPTVSTVQLLDLTGKKIVETKLPAGQRSMKIDITSRRLASGVYVLRILNGDIIITKKVMK